MVRFPSIEPVLGYVVPMESRLNVRKQFRKWRSGGSFFNNVSDAAAFVAEKRKKKRKEKKKKKKE